MEEREVKFVVIRGITIAAHKAICPKCTVLDLNSRFMYDQKNSFIGLCPKGHRWSFKVKDE